MGLPVFSTELSTDIVENWFSPGRIRFYFAEAHRISSGMPTAIGWGVAPGADHKPSRLLLCGSAIIGRFTLMPPEGPESVP